jgi:SAM-dependent methyltransferase
MPSYASKLSTTEIDNLVAYLSSLKGTLIQPGEVVTRTRSLAPVSENIDWLTRPERDADERPNAVLDALRIPEGAAVADVGAGTGYFTWRLAGRVGPNGRVTAVEIQPKMLDHIAQDVKNRKLTNVDLVLGGERDPACLKALWISCCSRTRIMSFPSRKP